MANLMLFCWIQNQPMMFHPHTYRDLNRGQCVYPAEPAYTYIRSAYLALTHEFQALQLPSTPSLFRVACPTLRGHLVSHLEHDTGIDNYRNVV